VPRNGYHAAVKVGATIYDAFTGPIGHEQAIRKYLDFIAEFATLLHTP
jgi:hypothetical protein